MVYDTQQLIAELTSQSTTRVPLDSDELAYWQSSTS